MKNETGKGFWPMPKLFILAAIILIYIGSAAGFKLAVNEGWLQKSPPSQFYAEGEDTITNVEQSILPNLESAQYFFERNLARDSGHVELYMSAGKNKNFSDRGTNSEAISYYMLWTANEHNKKKFDVIVNFMESSMLHKNFGYMMWRLEQNDTVVGDGSNIATDADLRAIKALLIAEKQWGDRRYSKLISQLAEGIEKIGITDDGYLVPYAGISGEDSVWRAQEVWLSYTDFTVLEELSKRRGEPWSSLYNKMKRAVLKAQIHNGLYNSMLTERREYGNGIDGGGYSINSMWIMTRAAESDDQELRESASKSLNFYKQKFEVDAELYSMYSSNGDAMSPSDTPWVYALVGRAAVSLDDHEFADQMMQKLVEHQVKDTTSPYAGAFMEGFGDDMRIGQFTMQESILTMQDFLKKGPDSKT